MDLSTKKEGQTLSSKKNLVYYLILVLIPIIILSLFELSLRIFNFGYDLGLFRKSNNYPHYYEINQNVAKRFFTKYGGTEPSNDIFLIKKPDTCYRVFVMGCSTARGFPYKMGVTFSRILYYRLQDIFPNKRIEVVNMAMAAINSYTQADFIDEILAMQPNAILIYTGHNEFYGALGVGSVENGGNVRWVKRMHLYLIRFRTYQLIQKSIGFIEKLFVSDNSNPIGTLMQRIAKEKAIGYKSELYNAGIDQFRVNMSEVVEKIKKAGIPVILSDVVSNIHGIGPFKSIGTDKFSRADSLFSMARKLEKVGKLDEARQAYYLAKDLDCVRFRAPEDLNSVIYDIGTKYNVPILGMKKVFEQHSPNGIIGDNLMTEHLHPNIEGHFLMADAFLNLMRKDKFISQDWDTSRIKPSSFYRSNWGFTALDSLHADITVKSLKASWPFKPETVVNNFLITYTPNSLEDTLAFMCIKTNMAIEEKHRELAEIYKSRGEFLKAYMEYYSLIKSYPYLYDLYSCALSYLDLLGDNKKALDLMLSFPDKSINFSASIKIGKIYQKLSQPLMAIQYYQNANKIQQPGDNPEDMYLGLYKAYMQVGNLKKGEEALNEVKAINPGFKTEDANKDKIVILLDNNIKVLLDEATILMQQQRFDEALEVLYKSQKIKETTIADHFIGNLLLNKGDIRALAYLEKAYKGDPKDANMLSNLCVAYIRNKNFERASHILDEFKIVSEDNSRIQKLTNYLDGEKKKQHK
jgi:tetratricopeptide (TPR) repeat protein